VAVVTDTEELTPPCGACRQILWEFCGDVEIVLANLRGKSETLQLGTLFPRAFDASFL
jgi:cytidine deaminase